MGLEEVGTQGVKKNDEKTKEKSKKDKKNMEKLKGGKESKNTKKNRVEYGSGAEASTYNFEERDKNESGKGSDICSQKNHVGSVIEKVGGKKKKGENSGVLDDKLQQSLDNVEGISMTTKGPDELQNRTDDSAVGQGSDRTVAMSGHKKTKRTSKESVGNLGFGAENMDEQEIFGNSNKQGESVEPFAEGNAFESVVNEEKRKKRKRRRDKSTEQEIFEKSDQQGESAEAFGEGHDSESVEKEEEKKKKKKKKRKKDVSIVSEGDMQGHDLIAQRDVVTKDEKKRKKKNKKAQGESGSSADTTRDLELDGHLNDGTKGKKRKAKSDVVGCKDPKPEKSKKKVSFSGKDEVFLLPEDNLVRGKRFSKEEDEIVKQAVFNYIETNCLGEEGLKMVLNCKSYPKIRNCWKEIGTALPHRPQNAVYYRAQTLFRRDEKRKWTKEDIEILRASHKKYGNQWSDVANELGKHRVHVKDTWRRIRHANLKKGRWSQDEYQTLFDLVNLDLRMKYTEEKKSKHGMLRDNVPWTAISDRLTTRADPTCCIKWYSQLTSPMVTDGDWLDSDDYRLIDALFELDASCYEDVDWDNLLEHRSGTICQKRWSEMVLHIGENSKRSFADQVEVLAKRYCPELLESKENWESKPAAP